MRAPWAWTLLLLAGMAGAAQDAGEGQGVMVEAGDVVALRLPEGPAWLQLGPQQGGLRATLTAPGSNASGEVVLDLDGRGIPLRGASQAELRILEGKGAMLLARDDLGGPEVAATEAGGTLAPGTCRSHARPTPWASASPPQDALLTAAGSGVSFRRWTTWVEPAEGAKSNLETRVYTGSEPVVLVQACHEGAEGARAYTVRVAPVPSEVSPSEAPAGMLLFTLFYALSGYGFLLAVLAAGFLVGLAVARRPRARERP